MCWVSWGGCPGEAREPGWGLQLQCRAEECGLAAVASAVLFMNTAEPSALGPAKALSWKLSAAAST